LALGGEPIRKVVPVFASAREIDLVGTFTNLLLSGLEKISTF
jgi:hypothetical protein